MTDKSFSILPEAYFDLLVRVIPGTIFIFALREFKIFDFGVSDFVFAYICGFIISLTAEKIYIWFKFKFRDRLWIRKCGKDSSDGESIQNEQGTILASGRLWKSLWIRDEMSEREWKAVRLEDFPVLKKMLSELYMFRSLRLLAPVCFLLLLNTVYLGGGWEQVVSLIFTSAIVLLFIKMPEWSFDRIRNLSKWLRQWTSILSLAGLALVLGAAYEIILRDTNLNDFSPAFEIAISLLIHLVAYGIAGACFYIIEEHTVDKANGIGLRFTNDPSSPPKS